MEGEKKYSTEGSSEKDSQGPANNLSLKLGPSLAGLCDLETLNPDSKVQTLSLVLMSQLLTALKTLIIVYMILSIRNLELGLFALFVLLEVLQYREKLRMDAKSSLWFFTLLVISWLVRVSTAAFYHSVLVELADERQEDPLHQDTTHRKAEEFRLYLAWTFPLVLLETLQVSLAFLMVKVVSERERKGGFRGLSWKFALNEIVFRLKKKNSLIY